VVDSGPGRSPALRLPFREIGRRVPSGSAGKGTQGLPVTGILIHPVNLEGSMRRGTMNAIVDTILGILFVPSLISALVLFFVLPSGGQGGESAVFLSVERSVWVTVHNYTGLLFIAFLIVHLVLHYRYLRHLDRHVAGSSRRPSGGEE
jgi:hypothetical protein